MDSLGSAAAPSNYEPAEKGLGDTNKTIGDRAGYIPRAMAEGAPGLATDLVAGAAGARVGAIAGAMGGPFAEVTVPAGAAIGGAIGFGGSYLARVYGNDVQRAAQARTGNPNATPNDEDKARALTAGVTSAALSRIGVAKALKAGTGVSTIVPTAKAFGKAAAIDAGTGTAADALNTTIVDRGDPSEDPSGLALSGLQGAATGAGLRSITAIGDVNNAVKFSDIDPQHAHALQSLYVAQNLSSPEKAYAAVKRVDDHLGVYADHWEEKAQPQIDALDEASGQTDDTGLLVKRVRQSLNDGNVVPSETLETLQDRLGDWREGDNLVRTLTLQSTQNQLKALGNFREAPDGTGTFGGGIADTDFARNVLSPFGRWGKYGFRGALADVGLAHLAPMLHLEPALATTLGVAQLGTHLGVKAFDGVLRNGNPIEEFSRRFGDGASQETPAQPSFIHQEAVADDTAQAVADLARKAVLKRGATPDATEEPKGADGLRYVRVGDQVVAFDPTTVANANRYAASVSRRMKDRMEVIGDAKAVLPSKFHDVLDTLHRQLTHNSSNSAETAYSHVEDAVNKLPPEYQGAVLDKLNQAKLWASYAR